MYSKSWQTSGNKYGAKTTIYKGNKYDSKREASEAMLLDQKIKNGEITSYQRQVKEELYGQNGTKICTYKVDFLLHYPDGSREYLEIKAKITETAVWRIKWKLLVDKYKNDVNARFRVQY